MLSGRTQGKKHYILYGFTYVKVFEQAKLKYGDRSQNSSCLWGQKEFSRKGHWGNRGVPHLDQDGGYTGNTFVKTQPNYVLFFTLLLMDIWVVSEF